MRGKGGALAVCLLAGGRGTRFGGEEPKQFQLLCGQPILARTLASLTGGDRSLSTVVVANPEYLDQNRRLVAAAGREDIAVVAGGASRQESVRHGLAALRAAAPGLVAIHDGVRPFVTRAELEQACRQLDPLDDGIIFARPVTETIKEVQDGMVSAHLDRRRLWQVQTPQIFRYQRLCAAFAVWPVTADATDDAAVMTAAGGRVRVFPGPVDNLKITDPADLERAEQIVRRRGGGTC